MYKKIPAVMIFLMAISNSYVFPDCASCKAHAQNAQSKDAQAVNVGNKICPVTGEKIDEKTKVTYEYQGKIYNFCCPACIPEFKKDPKKYIDKVNEELKSNSKEEKSSK